MKAWECLAQQASIKIKSRFIIDTGDQRVESWFYERLLLLIFLENHVPEIQVRMAKELSYLAVLYIRLGNLAVVHQDSRVVLGHVLVGMQHPDGEGIVIEGVLVFNYWRIVYPAAVPELVERGPPPRKQPEHVVLDPRFLRAGKVLQRTPSHIPDPKAGIGLYRQLQAFHAEVIHQV